MSRFLLHLLLSTVCALLSYGLVGQFYLPEMSEQIGWDADKKEKIDQLANNDHTKALLVYQDNELVYQFGDIEQAFHVFSVRKSLLSLLYGIYAEQGVIDLNATMADLGIDDVQGLTANEQQATIYDLLRARSGIYHPAAFETPGMMNNRPTRGQYRKDEKWFYNNWDFNALTTIFEKTTGLPVFEAFESSIASPLSLKFDKGIQKYHEEASSVHPATLWYLSANDLSRIGRMLLNHGQWKDQQVVPEPWIVESTAPYSNIDFLGGYGYCWWSAREGLHYPFINAPKGTFSARGTGEQNLVVFPKWKLVVVHLTEVTSPDQEMMKVTDFGRLLGVILDQKLF